MEELIASRSICLGWVLLLSMNHLFDGSLTPSNDTRAGGREKGEKHSLFPKKHCLVLVVERKMEEL